MNHFHDMTNKKVLIVCDMFPPAFGPRMGYLCKYMRQAGWNPVVVTEWIDDQTFAFLTDGIETHYVHYFPNAHRGKLIRRLEWLAVFTADLLFQYKSKKMARVARERLREGGFIGVLSSTYRTFPLPVALMMAREFHLPLIADHRDIIEQYASDEFISRPFHTLPFIDRWITRIYRSHLLKSRNKALRQANHVTTVSPWHVEQLAKINSNVSLIYNGYDPEIFYPKIEKTERFNMTYTGRLLSLAPIPDDCSVWLSVIPDHCSRRSTVYGTSGKSPRINSVSSGTSTRHLGKSSKRRPAALISLTSWTIATTSRPIRCHKSSGKALSRSSWPTRRTRMVLKGS